MTLNLVSESPSSEYVSYESIIASIDKSTNGSNEGDQLGTKTVHLGVPSGYAASILISQFEVDDWGYIKISGKTAKGHTMEQVTLADMERQEDRRGPRGGHTRWGVSGKTLVLPAGNYDIEISQTNEPQDEPYASYNASYCNLDMSIRYLTAPVDDVYPTHFDVEFDSRRRIDNPVKNSSKSRSGWLYEGTVKVTLSDYSTFSFPVQSGGWMATASPWVSQISDYVPNDTVTNFDETLWPDTSCPALSGTIHTKNSEPVGAIDGYPIKLNSASAPDTVNGVINPDKLRSGIELHAAEREGSEGCISTFDFASLSKLDSLMVLLNTKGLAPSIRVSYNPNIAFGETCPNPLRKP